MPVEYDGHAKNWQEVLTGDRHAVGETWLRSDTLDAWRHRRMLEPLSGLVRLNPSAEWLTVGDGRYGSDARGLADLGATSVHASDMFDELLREGHMRGYVDTYSKQNAEALSFADDSFDYTLCKEALHHLPRPYHGLHEMLRVSRRAVTLIEPRDRRIDRSPFEMVKHGLRQVAGVSEDPRYGFEEVGNFLYAISERELEKAMLGLHLTSVGFCGVNDVYLPGAEFASFPPVTDEDRNLHSKLTASLAKAEKKCRFGMRRSDLLVAVLFRKAPSLEEQDALTSNGFEFCNLPNNPYR